jgi:hypothetical protein
MAYTKYSLTPADNNAAPPNGAPEGMLPSAVNDTMRDMMAQIRDVGDGIRGGTYTMTAPVITGGSITGVALSGNTFTNPVITGGSINNTPIGATTASTGKFSTLTNAALTSGRVTYAGTSGVLQDDADFTFNGTTVTMANDASISGLTVGKGGGASGFNTAVGVSALNANTSGVGITAVGWNSLLLNTSGESNSAFGFQALQSNTSGAFNVALGRNALNANTTASNNTAVGYQAGFSNTTGYENTAVGYQSLYSNTTGENIVAVGRSALLSNTTGIQNTAVGAQALRDNTTGESNTAVGLNALALSTTGSNNTATGRGALQQNTTGGSNTAFGRNALLNNTTAANNTAMGFQAAEAITTGDENVIIGDNALPAATTAARCTIVGRIAGTNITTGADNTGIGRYSLYGLTTGSGNVGLGDILAGGQIFAITTESNRLIAGHNAITNAYVKVAWTVTSDSRDKTNVSDATYGLDFVTKLKPVTFKWDERSKYADGIPNGTHKGNKTQLGFLAQDVIALEESLGTPSNDLLVADNEQAENLKITESKMIPALVKAIQELKAEVDSLKQQLGK